MRIPCPFCGLRDQREFTILGSAEAMARPAPDAAAEAWDAFLHLRDNPAGETQELWYHEAGCGHWLVVSRDTTTHEVTGAQAARDVKRATQ